MAGLERLFERPGLPAFPLPAALAERYGGPLGFAEPRVIANFVESLDGVVAAPPAPQSSRLISGDSADDRFVMALLRGCADAIVIGSGTLHSSPRSQWRAAGPFPAAAEDLAALRRERGRPADPALVVLTGTGGIDAGHPALERGALVVTSAAGAERLAGRLPAACEVAVAGDERGVDVAAALALVHERGHAVVLVEAGPRVFGAMLAAQVVDELFLTVAPTLAGRAPDVERLGLIEGSDLLGRGDAAELLSVRRGGAHLLLRYRLR